MTLTPFPISCTSFTSDHVEPFEQLLDRETAPIAKPCAIVHSSFLVVAALTVPAELEPSLILKKLSGAPPKHTLTSSYHVSLSCSFILQTEPLHRRFPYSSDAINLFFFFALTFSLRHRPKLPAQFFFLSPARSYIFSYATL